MGNDIAGIGSPDGEALLEGLWDMAFGASASGAALEVAERLVGSESAFFE
jgi:hypothetical protein